MRWARIMGFCAAATLAGAAPAGALAGGEPLLLQCPDSAETMRYDGETVAGPASHRWTDGFSSGFRGLMLPEISRCGQGKIFWLKEAKIVTARISYLPKDPWLQRALDSAHTRRLLNEAEYHEALASGLARNPDEEKRLRILAWWAANDASRSAAWIPVPLKAETRANLEKLLGLLRDDETYSRLMKAEILRELGRFPEAVALTRESMAAKGFPRDVEVIRQRILELARRSDPQVRELPTIE